MILISYIYYYIKFPLPDALFCGKCKEAAVRPIGTEQDRPSPRPVPDLREKQRSSVPKNTPSGVISPSLPGKRRVLSSFPCGFSGKMKHF